MILFNEFLIYFIVKLHFTNNNFTKNNRYSKVKIVSNNNYVLIVLVINIKYFILS